MLEKALGILFHAVVTVIVVGGLNRTAPGRKALATDKAAGT